MPPLSCKHCYHCCQVLPRYLAKNTYTITRKYANGTTVTCRIFLGQNKFLTSHFEFFFAKFSAAWEHGQFNRSAAHSVWWQVLELIFGGLLTTHVCMPETSRSVHACVSETSGSIHACVSETHVSSTFPCTKRRKQSSAECRGHAN